MDLSDKIDSLENVSGVYIMKDVENRILYVGKSKNLKSRVKSYFIKNQNHSNKIKRMVKFINDIEIIKTDTELDALLLECKLIKDIKPMYNTLMKNDEEYVYLKINTKQEYPYIESKIDIDDDSLYFGPYSFKKKIDEIIKIISDVYKLRTCKNYNKCLRYDFNKCMGVCRSSERYQYKDNINMLIDDLNNNMVNCIKILNDNMQSEVSILNFEKASKINNDIKIIKSLGHKQEIIRNTINRENVLAYIKIDDYYKVYIIKRGLLLKSELIKLDEFINMDKCKYYIQNIDKIDNLISNSSIKKDDIDFINIVYSYLNNSNIEFIHF